MFTIPTHIVLILETLFDFAASVMQDPSETLLMDGELGFDAYSLGSCM